MNFWELWNFFRRLPISDLLDYPDFGESEPTREWLGAVLEALSAFAEMTNTQIDDEILRGLGSILDDDALWDILHGLLLRLIGEDMVVSDSATEVGSKVNLDPAIIMLIVQALRMLWEFFKERK